MHWIVETVRHYLLAWGYWAIVVGLLGENAGLPLPGETIMAFASFMAFRQHHLSFAWIIVVGTISATAGDNIGYLLGRSLGRRFLKKWKRLVHLDDEDIQGGEDPHPPAWFAYGVFRTIHLWPANDNRPIGGNSAYGLETLCPLECAGSHFLGFGYGRDGVRIWTRIRHPARLLRKG